MAAVSSQCRCLAGSKAFTGLRPRRVAAVANGAFATMKRKDSYMVEVNVGEDEPEDIAVRRFMKKVMDSRVLEQLRSRRYKESPRDEFKRRTRERIERIKNKVVEPTWEEEYGFDADPKPFQDFFPMDEGMAEFGGDWANGLMYDNDNFMNTGGYLDAGAQGGASWGQYTSNRGPYLGGQGAYIDGGYMNQGGYAQPQQGYQQYPYPQAPVQSAEPQAEPQQ